MSQVKGRALITDLEAYHKALKSCFASLEHGNPVFACIEQHIITLISDYVSHRLQDQSPFCILGVGSGDGATDLAFLEILSKPRVGKNEKVQFFERCIEPDKNMLEAFRTKAEHLPESLKSKANIEFEWHATTYQEYVDQKKEDDAKFDAVHFFHSLYYTGIEKTLEHCYHNELGAVGVILCTISSEDSPFVKYASKVSSQGLILNPGPYYNNRDVKDVAEKNGWKYVECSGELKNCDITGIFDSSSQEGNQLLNFLTQWVDLRATASEDDLQNILNFWESESVDDGHGRKMVTMRTGVVIIFKGM